MKIDFDNQVVLVTGGTRGIGKVLVDEFSALGAEVWTTGTKVEEIEKLNALAQKEKNKRRYFCVDFSSRESTLDFIKQLATASRIDVCVNNAGINRLNLIDDVLTQDWDDMISVNLTAPFLILRDVAKKMKMQKYGRIINIASIFGHISKAKRAAYSATKFGLHGMTVALASEVSRYGVLVNTVSPGFTLTDLTRKNLSSEEMASLAQQIPVGRLAEPEEISRIVVFLASRLNTYMTGQNIIVDGGFVNV